MAYTFGDLLGGSNVGDPRRGTFGTGAQYDSGAASAVGKVSWPSNSPAPTFGGQYGTGKGSSFIPSLGFQLGQAVDSVASVAGLNSPASRGINTAQVDGNTGFGSSIAGLTQAILRGVGAGDGGTVQPAMGQSYPAQTTQGGTIAGVDVKTLAVVGIVAAGLYYALR